LSGGAGGPSLAGTIGAVTKRTLALLLLLSACGNQTQTSSGAAYQAAWPDFNPALGSPIDQAVARTAAVEPLLRFPARIGLARINNGYLVGVPEREGDAWIAFSQSHTAYGEFVPVSPLVAEMAEMDLATLRGEHDARPVKPAMAPVRRVATTR